MTALISKYSSGRLSVVKMSDGYSLTAWSIGCHEHPPHRRTVTIIAGNSHDNNKQSSYNE